MSRIAILLLFAPVVLSADPIDDYLQGAMARQHVPGLTVAILKDGEVVKSRGYGSASLELNVPAATNTVYELASAAKPLVATGILLLVGEGKVALEDRIAGYVDDVPESWSPVTIRHLLSHTSGIKDYLERPEMTPFDLPPPKIVEIAAGFPLNFEPGERWAYSNTGYVLLGMVIERVSGRSLGSFLEERIFKPAGMSATWHHQPDGVYPNRAAGYLWLGPGGIRNADMFKYMISNRGDAGVISIATDLVKFTELVTTPSTLPDDIRTSMWTATRLNDGTECNYGLGWFVGEVNGHRHLYHPGGNAGAASIISIYPDDKLTIILLSNGGGAYPEGMDLGIAQRLIEGLMPDPRSVDPAVLESYAGYYNAYGRQLLRVTVEKGGLFLTDGGGLANLFLPLTATNFVAEDANRGCSFWRSPRGEITGMTLRLGVDEMPVQRIGPTVSKVDRGGEIDPNVSRRIELVLKAMARGGEWVKSVDGIAEGARRHYSRGPAPELAGIESVQLLADHPVTGSGIERHDGKVAKVWYCRIVADGEPRNLLVYLTADGLVIDQDVLSSE